MAQRPVICPKTPLPRDLDVQVTISRPITEIATDMTLMCFLTPNAPFPPDNGRVRYYSTFDALAADFPATTQAYYAGQAFFARSVRPLTMAVGRVFEDPVPAGLMAGTIAVGPLLRGVTDGAFDLEINGGLVSVTGLDFSAAHSLADVAAVLETALSGKGAIVSNKYDSIVIETIVSGDGAGIEYAASPTAGTDVAAMLGLTRESGGTVWPGYSPGTIAEEAALVRAASKCNQRPPYGWTLDAKYRDTEAQKIFADWAESVTPAYFSACTNSAAAYDTADAANIGHYAANKGYIRTSTIYHDNAQVYPDVSYIALALATNYALPDSAITMKFKQLDGIEPSPMTETALAALNARRINCYVYIGNTSRTVREGVQALDTWYTDSLVNLDNFREELQAEVFNVFLRNKKLPYTTPGQDKLVSAAAKICRRYTSNGVFADRDVEDDTETGYTTLPATSIEPVHVSRATTSERASRVAPPIRITAYEAGAFHKVAVNVDVYN